MEQKYNKRKAKHLINVKISFNPVFFLMIFLFILSPFSLSPHVFFHSFYIRTESSRKYKSQNGCIPFVKWMIIGKNTFFISITWVSILCITGDKQIIPRTHIHSYPSNYYRSTLCKQVIYSFTGRMCFVVTKKNQSLCCLS